MTVCDMPLPSCRLPMRLGCWYLPHWPRSLTKVNQIQISFPNTTEDCTSLPPTFAVRAPIQFPGGAGCGMAHSNPHASWCQVTTPIGKSSPGCRCYTPPPAGRSLLSALYRNIVWQKKTPARRYWGKVASRRRLVAQYPVGQTRQRRRSTAMESDRQRPDPAQQYHLPGNVTTRISFNATHGSCCK